MERPAFLGLEEEITPIFSDPRLYTGPMPMARPFPIPGGDTEEAPGFLSNEIWVRVPPSLAVQPGGGFEPSLSFRDLM